MCETGLSNRASTVAEWVAGGASQSRTLSHFRAGLSDLMSPVA